MHQSNSGIAFGIVTESAHKQNLDSILWNGLRFAGSSHATGEVAGDASFFRDDGFVGDGGPQSFGMLLRLLAAC